MRDAVGSTWIFALVIAFTLIFSGFLVLALAYSKVYRLKNETLTIIEKYNGYTYNIGNDESVTIINQYLNNSNYKATGTCDDYKYGVKDLSSSQPQTVTKGEKYLYCVSYVTDNSTCETTFQIRLFYDFNLPVLGKLRMYDIKGQTNSIYKAYVANSQISCS